MFKVGDKVRRVRTSGNSTTPVGFEGVIRSIENDGGISYIFDNDAWGYDDSFAEWEIVTPEGPVRTETVTKRRIVPGVYGRLEVTVGATPDRVRLGLTSDADNKAHWVTTLTATELDDLAMVASQLAEALRDVD